MDGLLTIYTGISSTKLNNLQRIRIRSMSMPGRSKFGMSNHGNLQQFQSRPHAENFLPTSPRKENSSLAPYSIVAAAVCTLPKNVRRHTRRFLPRVRTVWRPFLRHQLLTMDCKGFDLYQLLSQVQRTVQTENWTTNRRERVSTNNWMCKGEKSLSVKDPRRRKEQRVYVQCIATIHWV